MEIIFGTILRGTTEEVLETDRLGKALEMFLDVAIREARLKINQNRDIHKINIYRNLQGQKILMHAIAREGNLICG